MFQKYLLPYNLDSKTIRDTRQILQRLANSRCVEVAIEIHVRLGEEEDQSKRRGQTERGSKAKRYVGRIRAPTSTISERASTLSQI